MATIQIGKYKRPGIIIEEFNNSVISSPTVEGIVNTIIGVSRKGPVNTPVLLKNIGDLEAIYGPLDRQLERKGSFFHRTISKLLEASPVYAINLLQTDDNLDKIEYQSLSCATTVHNDIERLGAYRRFFDTTGFWKRDTDRFISLTTENVGHEGRLLNFTNLSDKYVTIFIFKSKKIGFDRSLIEWYGSIEKLPPYVYPNDMASDYLVDVVIVGGDYSNYQTLAIDSRFSQYFSNEGLRKDQVRNFTTDVNVNTLSYVEGLSLIPYFRDLDGNNIFIETVINRNTDKHGVLCAFNSDLFETDYPKGLIDLIGNNLVGDDLTSNPPISGGNTIYGSLDTLDGVNDGHYNVNFLSYKERITESVSFTQQVLDRPGNVFALFGTSSMPSAMGDHSMKDSDKNTNEGGFIQGEIYDSNRTYWFSDGYVNDLYVSSGLTSSGSTMSITYEVDSTSNNGYAVINGQFIPVVGQFPLEVTANSFQGSLTSTQSYFAAFVLDTTGTVKTVTTTQVQPTTPLVAASDIVLGYASFSVYSNNFVGVPQVFDVTLDNTEVLSGAGDAQYLPLMDGIDHQYTDITTDSFRVVFLDTNQSISPRDYARYRRLKAFNQMLDFLDSSASNRGAFLTYPDGIASAGNPTMKNSLSAVTVSDIRDVNTQNRSFVINITLPGSSTNVIVEDDYVDDYFVSYTDVIQIVNNSLPFVIYKLDDELIMGVDGATTKPEEAELNGLGVVSRWSSLYRSYDEGVINTGDVIYQKVNYSPVSIQFVPGEDINDNLAGYDYIIFGVNRLEEDYLGNTRTTSIFDKNELFFNTVSQNYQFLINAPLNSGAFTVASDAGLSPNNPNQPYTVPSSANGDSVNGRAWMLSDLSGGSLSLTGSSTFSYFAYEVEQSVRAEVLASIQNLKAYGSDFEDRPLYLDMFMDNNLNLTVHLEDPTLQTIESFGTITGGSGDTEALVSNMIFNVRSFISNYKQSVEIEEPDNYTPSPNKILVRGSRYTEVKIGDYLEATYVVEDLEADQMPKKLTRIVSKKTWALDTTLVEITCDSEIKISDFGNSDKQTFRYTSIDSYISSYKAISLKGFRIRQASLPDGTEDKQSSILNLVAKGTPLFKAITNKEAFDFRYLVDSFGLGLIERSKQQLLDICGERLDVLGFINMPSMKSFKNSTSPSFVDSEGVLQVEFIASGGDPESSPSFLYTMGDGNGVTSVGYFAPYLTVNDNGRPIDVPPAAYVALTYMRKHNSTLTNIVPWTIAAGISNGRVTNIAGLEIDFTPEDIEFLNLAQMNPIVFKRNRGWVIETENTALTLNKSALSYIHVREVLIELERELSAMLLEFQWKFNTPEVRAEIKLRADVICETYRSKNGLYNYFNKCDEENNTSEIIDNQIGVLDTFCEPIKGLAIIVNNITILRTGAISAGGFIQQ